MTPNETKLHAYLDQPWKRARSPPPPHAAMVDNAPDVLRAMPRHLAAKWWRPSSDDEALAIARARAAPALRTQYLADLRTVGL